MSKIALVVILLFTFVLSAGADPANWTEYPVCSEGLDLSDVGRSYNYRLFIEGHMPGGNTTGIATVPEWLPIITKIDRATEGSWTVEQERLVSYYGPGIDYWSTLLTSQKMLEVGTGEPDPFVLGCAITSTFGNSALWESSSVAQGAELTFTHVAFTVEASIGNATVHAVLLDVSSGSLELVHAINLNTLSGKTASQPMWADVAISLELLLNPGLGEGASGTLTVGEDQTAFNASLDDLWVEVEGLNEEPQALSSYSEFERADLNMDGVVGGPDFVIFGNQFGKTN